MFSLNSKTNRLNFKKQIYLFSHQSLWNSRNKNVSYFFLQFLSLNRNFISKFQPTCVLFKYPVRAIWLNIYKPYEENRDWPIVSFSLFSSPYDNRIKAQQKRHNNNNNPNIWKNLKRNEIVPVYMSQPSSREKICDEYPEEKGANFTEALCIQYRNK